MQVRLQVGTPVWDSQTGRGVSTARLKPFEQSFVRLFVSDTSVRLP